MIMTAGTGPANPPCECDPCPTIIVCQCPCPKCRHWAVAAANMAAELGRTLAGDRIVR